MIKSLLRFNKLTALILAVLLCAVGINSGLAANSSVATPASRYIEALASEALATISNSNLGKEKKQAVLEKLFRENIDFKWSARFVMGKFWRQASEEQKKNYVAAYQNFIIKNYTTRFLEYTSGKFAITGSKDAGSGEWNVGMEIFSGEGSSEPPVVVEYRLRKGDGGFKVIDIVVEGVSMITTQRSEFASVINKDGIDGLIARLSANK